MCIRDRYKRSLHRTRKTFLQGGEAFRITRKVCPNILSLLYLFKPRKDRYLSTITTLLDGAGITANEVTALGLCLALGAGLLAYYGHLYTGLSLFAAGVVCDALDGSFARISTMGTEFGLYFDGVADRFSELFFVSGAVQGAHVLSFAFVLVGGGFAL